MPVTIGGSGPITGVTSINTSVSDTELGYLDGVTSALQTQLAGKADTSGNGAWTSWSPTANNYTVGNGTVTAAYVQIGKLVAFRFHFVLGSTSSISGDFYFSLPNASKSGYFTPTAGLYDTGTGDFLGFATISGSTCYVRAVAANGTYASYATLSSTVPFTWTTNDIVSVTGTYEAA